MDTLKLTDIMEDWFPETFPGYSFTADYQPYLRGHMIASVGKVFRMDGVHICRVTDVELIPWINHRSIPNLHAADPEFFEKIERWVRNDVLFSLSKREIDSRIVRPLRDI
jgi:hypothetical protein